MANNYGITARSTEEIVRQLGGSRYESPYKAQLEAMIKSGYESPYKAQLEAQAAKMGTYETPWSGKLNEGLGQLADYSYDKFKGTTGYNALLDEYRQGSDKAMNDTLAQISARTGGLASSYAGQAGQAAYDRGMRNFEAEAYRKYLDEFTKKQGTVAALAGADKEAYGRYGDYYNALSGLENAGYAKYKDRIAAMLDAEGSEQSEYARYLKQLQDLYPFYAKQEEKAAAEAALAAAMAGRGVGGDPGSLPEGVGNYLLGAEVAGRGLIDARKAIDAKTATNIFNTTRQMSPAEITRRLGNAVVAGSLSIEEADRLATLHIKDEPAPAYKQTTPTAAQAAPVRRGVSAGNRLNYLK